MNNIYIILVEPVYRGNVGSVARIMNNFSYTNLRIVGSIPVAEDFVLGVHSDEILDTAVIFPTFEAAIADMDRVIALSRRKGAKKKVDMYPRELANYVHEVCSDQQIKIGLVFGRETFGLTDAEAEQCDLRCFIPANEAFPSLNLAQAVGIIIYEIYFMMHIGDADLSKIQDTEYATKPHITEAIDFSLETLDTLNIFRDDEDRSYLSNYLHSLLYRSNATKQMTIDLKKLFNRIHIAFLGKGKGYKV